MSKFKFKVGQRVKYSFRSEKTLLRKSSHRHGAGVIESREVGVPNSYYVRTPRCLKFMLESELRLA